MALKRFSFVYQGEIPSEISSLTANWQNVSIAKDGLCDFHSIRVSRAIINIQNSNAPGSTKVIILAERLLNTLKAEGKILDFSALR